MKVAVYDPLRTFTAFAPYMAKKVDLMYVDYQMKAFQRESLHAQADVVWYEFATHEFARDVERIRRPAYTVCRLHSYELFTELPMSIKWDNVDKLLVVSPFVMDMLRKKQRHIDYPPMDILFNGVDLDKFTIPGNKTYGKNICVLGFINYKKNLPFAIQCLDAVRDGGYHMHFIGESQDKRFDFYLQHIIDRLGLKEQVTFHGPIPHQFLPAALHEMDYIASFSLFESFGQGIMEGIASGCIPAVHDFPGASERFPYYSIFQNVKDFKQKVDYQDVEMAGINREGLHKYSLSAAKSSLDCIIEDIESAVSLGV